VQSSGLPSWVPSPGTFADASTNLPSAVDPCPAGGCVYTRVSGQAAVFTAWTSGTYASELGSLGSYVTWGGGHTAYDGNEVYRCDLNTRLWSRMGSPSLYSQASNPVDSTGAFPDGKPAPPHTYQTLGILPSSSGGGTSGSLIQACQPAMDDGGIGRFSSWWRFDFAAQTWSRFVNSSAYTASTYVGTLSQKTMVQEPGSHCWWFGGGFTQSIYRVSPAGVITAYPVGINSGGALVGGVVPGPRILVLHGMFSGQATWIFDLAAIEAGGTTATASKRIFPTGTAGSNDGSMTWCPDVNGFACIDSASPTTVRWLKPSNPASPWDSTWAWTSETFTASGGAIARPRTNGANGCFVWAPAIKCFLWAAVRGAPLQVYRPTGT
jgi:hypothetical protein